MIGRTKEVSDLNRLYERESAELVAVYGRRRVGKTFLIDETFKGKITFRHAGLSPVEMSEESKERPLRQQLQAFYYSLLSQGMKAGHCPKDWLEAFFMLEMFLQELDTDKKLLIFLDELPWMDTPKSGFITAFEAFWNSWACYRNIMVVISGSATSWIKDKLINNHGGLYGRVTYEIKLEPFTLRECEQLLNERNISLSRYDIVQSYMIFGGIPYYFNYFKRGESLPMMIDDLFFKNGAVLKIEYDRLFSSIFGNPEMMKSIIGALNTKSKGLSRKDIAKLSGISEGGTLTEALKALEASDFIIRYIPFGHTKKDELYKLVDHFCIFYLRFVDKYSSLPDTFWQQSSSLSPIVSWRGYAFENVCVSHIAQIKKKLGISGISTTESPWSVEDNEGIGTQIDLIISRKDNIVNMCEMKFYSDIFTVDKQYDMVLRNRQSLLREAIPKRSSIHNTLITTYGIKENEYRWSFDNVITMDDLFE